MTLLVFTVALLAGMSLALFVSKAQSGFGDYEPLHRSDTMLSNSKQSVMGTVSFDETPRNPDGTPIELQTATFGLGCFWSPDADFGSLPGVYRTRVGYCGGRKANPSYYDLGDHTEAIQIDFDPRQISYSGLLKTFFAHHNAAKPAYSMQYRSVVFFHNEDQRATAASAIQAEAERLRVRKLATSLEPMGTFHRAENYHQKYYLTHDKALMDALRSLLPDQRSFEDSTLVMRLNALAGHYQLSAEIQLPLDALGPAAQLRVQELQAYNGGPAIKCAQ
jgi:peptide-methionine (S)-S-oxide reductase